MYNVKGTVEIGLWKSDTNVFSFIDVYPGIFVYWRNIIQISYTDHIYTLLPGKEPPWRRNQTRAQREAQRCKQTGSRCVEKSSFSVLDVGIVTNCVPFNRLYIKEYGSTFSLKPMCI